MLISPVPSGLRLNGFDEIPYTRRPLPDGPEVIERAIVNLSRLLDRYEPSERQWSLLRRLTMGPAENPEYMETESWADPRS